MEKVKVEDNIQFKIGNIENSEHVLFSKNDLIITEDSGQIFIGNQSNLLKKLSECILFSSILFYDSWLNFPITGEFEKIYVDKLNKNIYRWNGAIFIKYALENISVVKNIKKVKLPNVNGYIEISNRSFDYEDGTVEVFPTSGFEPFTYLWNISETTKKIENLDEGEYSVIIKDAIGTVSELLSGIVEKDPDFGVDNITIIEPRCYESEDASIFISVISGVPPYTYFWFNDNYDLLLSGEINNIGDIGSGTYYYEIIDSSNPTKFLSGGIDVIAPTELQINILDTSNNKLKVEAIGGHTENVEYYWGGRHENWYEYNLSGEISGGISGGIHEGVLPPLTGDIVEWDIELSGNYLIELLSMPYFCMADIYVDVDVV